MTRYALKDKARQAQLDALSDVEKFSEQLPDACRQKLSNSANFVTVHFGKITLENEEGGKYYFSEFSVRILKSDIEVIEDLKPGVWYTRDRFDGNPNKHLLVEHCVDEDGLSFFDLTEDGYAKTYLRSETTHFMYIEWPEPPEPYQPEQEDNHPDAITAKKYVEGDTETVKALTIFDEE